MTGNGKVIYNEKARIFVIEQPAAVSPLKAPMRRAAHRRSVNDANVKSLLKKLDARQQRSSDGTAPTLPQSVAPARRSSNVASGGAPSDHHPKALSSALVLDMDDYAPFLLGGDDGNIAALVLVTPCSDAPSSAKPPTSARLPPRSPMNSAKVLCAVHAASAPGDGLRRDVAGDDDDFDLLVQSAALNSAEIPVSALPPSSSPFAPRCQTADRKQARPAAQRQGAPAPLSKHVRYAAPPIVRGVLQRQPTMSRLPPPWFASPGPGEYDPCPPSPGASVSIRDRHH